MNCTAPHEVLLADRDLWNTLPLIGYMRLEADETGPLLVLEQRNCACNGTLSIDVSAEVSA